MNFYQVGNGQHGGEAQRDTVHHGMLGSLFHGNAADQYRGHDEHRTDEMQSAFKRTIVEDRDQKKCQAGNQGHDQRRGDRDHEIVSECFLETLHVPVLVFFVPAICQRIR